MKRDWIVDLQEQGLLTREQADDARLHDAPLAPPAPAAGCPGDFVNAPTPLSGMRLLTCSPCDKAFGVNGAESAEDARCPECGGDLHAMKYSRLSGSTPPPAGSAPFTPDSSFSGKPVPFGRYMLRRELGHGGMGIVWEAIDTDLGRPVALKMLLGTGKDMEGEGVERLLREARAAARLRHPGIVGILDIGQAEGRHYFTMDLVPGKSFEQLLGDPGFPERRRVEVVASVAEALGAAHREGIVHRDVKPSNIIVDSQGRPVLVDFGIARDGSVSGNALTLTGVLVGTPSYMSPEHALSAPGSASPPSDVFSLGVVLFRALTGRFPFTQENVQMLLMAIFEDEAPVPSSINAGVARDLDTICLKCLEKKPERRYPDGSALAADLRRWLAGEPIQARPVSRARRFFRRLFHFSGAGMSDKLRKVEEEYTLSSKRAQGQVEALKKLERAREALEQARQTRYDRNATSEELVRSVDSAQSLIEQSLALSPDLALGYYLLGHALALRGHDDRAEAAWRRAIQLDPEFGPAHFHLGSHIVELAIFEHLSWSIEKRPLYEEAMRLRFAEGHASLARALQLGSGFEDEARQQVTSALGACARGDTVQAVEICRDGIRRFPRAEGREIFHWLLGFCEAAPADQLRGFDGALQVCPHHVPALAARGSAKARLGLLNEALIDLEESIRLRPWNLQTVIRRGNVRTLLAEKLAETADEIVRFAPKCMP